MQWDVFCRVVDNFGDVGVCWRAAADLAARGERVRLWIDDASALAWMAPGGHPRVEVHAWPDEDGSTPTPGDVVVEAFGCDPPAPFVARMAAMPRPPAWINLEYLSAEDYVERSHGLPSPQPNGMTKWFFYPGFTPRTGGLLREPGLVRRQAGFDRLAWLAARGSGPLAGERVVSLFCYDNPRLPALLDRLAQAPTLLLVAAGTSSAQVAAALGPSLTRGALRAVLVPCLSQIEYDHLLWACDLNFVRGEDSFVRAQWAARSFVWQIYPQRDGAHAPKLQAFERRFLAGASPELAAGVGQLWLWWNGLGDSAATLPPLQPWARHCAAWREALLGLTDLNTRLLGFVAERR
ncbi:elongation factor P maturation arginine rhamnosyltransferase EarP [Piscinibacter sp. XHJ-5]|uniref:elongation factor P maturation arginine rhamnosyltransferase EarP n=1 Tax=Piscinibacter sp. XHJ-5 TaxID=3037797 RepID=UPI002452CC7A|nr:elongation factor P maturation arginine rhamnosyltransferase EarP [Piscinibacter sp. XHJ-5]